MWSTEITYVYKRYASIMDEIRNIHSDAHRYLIGYSPELLEHCIFPI